MLYKLVVLKYFASSEANTPTPKSLLLKKRFWHRCFPVSFTKFLRAPFCRTPPDDCLLDPFANLNYCPNKLHTYMLPFDEQEQI